MPVSTVIHVGIVKAASTTLQEVYNFDSGELQALFASEQNAATATGRIASLSAEAFSICDRANRVMTAERLREVCGPAKIIAVLRNQIDWVSSRYVHNYVKSIPETRLKFDDWLYSHWKRDTFSYRHHADFDTMLRVYSDIFGVENVSIVLLEDLIFDKHKFVTDLCTMIGINTQEGIELLETAHNEKRGSKLGYMRRRLGFLPNVAFSQILPKPLYELAGKLTGGKMNPVFTDEWRNEIENYYRSGNRNVADRFGIDLGARGYTV